MRPIKHHGPLPVLVWGRSPGADGYRRARWCVKLGVGGYLRIRLGARAGGVKPYTVNSQREATRFDSREEARAWALAITFSRLVCFLKPRRKHKRAKKV